MAPLRVEPAVNYVAGTGTIWPVARLMNAPTWSMEPYRNRRARRASAFDARTWLTNGDWRSRASTAEQLGPSSVSCLELRISGYRSATVGRRLGPVLVRFFGWPRMNCPAEWLFPESNHYLSDSLRMHDFIKSSRFRMGIARGATYLASPRPMPEATFWASR